MANVRIAVPAVFNVPPPQGVPPIASSSVMPVFPDRPETNAIEHWLLGNDESSLIGLKGASNLTRSGVAPSYFSGYLTTADGALNGLASSVLDRDEFTIVAVAKFDSASAGSGRVLMGTAQATGGDGLGASALQTTTGGIQGLTRPNPSATFFGSSQLSAIVDKWAFLAFSVSKSEMKQKQFVGGIGGFEVATPSAYTKSARGFGVGSAYYNAATYTKGISVAEFIVLPYLSNSEIESVYARSKLARMPARGIEVY